MLDKKICAGRDLKIPRHLAIIMDGNGRWAERKGMSRIRGHHKGADVVTNVIESATALEIQKLTLFAFSSENWRRPQAEVSALMELFALSLKRQVAKLNENNIRLNVIGDISRFSPSLVKSIEKAQDLTCNNDGLTLNIAANYGGRWDMVQATRVLASMVKKGQVQAQDIDESMLQQHLSCPDDVDLLIRTGGEMRISNFLLWQCAYAEFYVTDTLWPDFDDSELLLALQFFSKRERRFGMTSKQIQEQKSGY